MALTESSKKHWHPDPKVIDWLTSKRIAETDKVLEIGPGSVPFRRADVYVDFIDIPGLDPHKQFIKLDAATGKLPFPDKSFDFIYARHVLEDMWNPFQLCEEMSRVGKAGFIETPSPMAELGRGVDGSSPPYRGYHHHRYIIWAKGKQLRIVAKFPFIEYLTLDDAQIDELLQLGKSWNTPYLWTDRINYQHRQSPMDFSIPTDYGLMLKDAIEASKTSINDFYFQVDQRS